METPPNVMLLDPISGRSSKMLAALNQQGCIATLVTDYQTAWRTMAQKNFDVGLIPLEDIDPAFLPELEKLILDSGFEWVALADPQQVRNPCVRLALTRLFHSIHAQGDLSGLVCLLLHIARQHAIAAVAGRKAILHVANKSMISSTPSMRRVIEQIHVLADVDAPVFITGESGTGKELAARAIHELSSRAHAPFVAVNCGAIPPNLIQSELFGFEKGAFTDAHCRRIGKIEAAAGGTLFLDEISELPYDLQATFLRFIESRSISRLGSHKETKVDARIVAATNRHVPTLVEEGRFRLDLFYRLNVLEVWIPPLRERKQDIKPLVELFFEQFKQYKPPGLIGFSTQAMALLQDHDWPGNIRELMNTVCRAMLMSNPPYIEVEDISIDKSAKPHQPPSLEQIREQAERNTLLNALKRNHHNIARTSREMGVSRVTLYRLMDKYDIQRVGDRL
ncbi:sigma-54 interaction domain-containing protein [Halomonas sp. A29]|uniref:sigma-54 interaction domain-containing protein n=1 Tax=Halomonas sp. A29 TaxID=3102786 RepID=UPI00398B86CA